MARKINVKYVVRDSSANLIKNNDVMPIGVISYETDTNKVKLSDGEKSYNNLPYVSSDSSSLNMDYSQLLGKPQINSVELSGNKSLDDLGIAAKNAVYTKEEVDAKVTSVYKFKGSVANEASLPSEGNVIGDVYNAEDTGANYAWNGTSWDKLSETIDLSGYLTIESAVDTYATKNDVSSIQGNLEAQIAGKADSSALNNYYSKTQTDELLAGKVDESAFSSLASDVDNIGNVIIPEMNENTAKALDMKVQWDEQKKVISLPMDGSISALREANPAEGTQPEGGILIAQRTYDEGATLVTEVGTTKNKLTLNASERPQIDIVGGTSEKVAYQSDIPDVSGFATSEELADYALKSELPEVPEKLPNPEALTVTVNNKAFVTYDGSAAITQNLVMNAETIPLNADTALTVAYGLEEVTPMFIQIPLRTLQDKVYEQETIIGWFGQKDIASIKQKLVKNVPVFVKYGIALSGNPHYYKFPAEYCAFESANQIKLVFQGLNTKDDVVSKYEILINLDGTIIEGNSNVKITITSLEVDASTINYNELNNKPQINSIELSGNKSLDDLGIQPKGEYLTSASIANKADKATTLAGYGITDAYTKGEVDSALVNKANESDVIEQDSSIVSLLSRLDLLESRLSNLSKQSEEIVENTPSEAISLDEEKDYIVSGDRESNMTIANALSIDYSNSTVSNNARIKLNSTNETSLNNIKYSGNFDKSTGNTVTSIQNSKYVNIKNCTMLSDSNCYNAIEIGLNGEVLAKSILIDNCVFDGSCSNNAISIFGTENNVVININNCEFNNVSNVLRLSNRTNANNITINITNCKCNSWVTSPIEYTGMILCQDYTSTSASAVKENNLFAPSKITINICNFILPNGQKLSMPENMSDICGSKNDNQILYVYADKEGYVDYDSLRYPTVNII